MEIIIKIEVLLQEFFRTKSKFYSRIKTLLKIFVQKSCFPEKIENYLIGIFL